MIWNNDVIKPDWNIFKEKFSENPQNNFEWFCYILFCKEFKKHTGIFRYKNQSAIETDAVENDGEIIGWQSKFYDMALSSKKGELIGTLFKANREYPNITKLIFYSNKEWGQYRGNEPKGKVEIEKKAKELHINLVWRLASFFESEFVSIENELISRHFFSLDKGIFDAIEKQQKHTEIILKEIQTCITFNEQSIEIDRKEIIDKINNGIEQVLILSGIGGVGKTAAIKKLYEQLKNTVPFFVFSAKELVSLSNINDIISGFDFHRFVEAYKDEKIKIIVIDAAEKIFDIENPFIFRQFLDTLIQHKWRLIFTTRSNYLKDLNTDLFEIYHIAPINITIQNLDLTELRSISDHYLFSLPKDRKLLDLIKNPFYLNEYLRFYGSGEEINYVDFKNNLWNKIIKKSKPAREQCFLKIAFERANKGLFYVTQDCESRILDDELLKDGILGYESPYGYFITHDIYEEWALEKIIESEFEKKENNHDFFDNLGHSLPVRRSFRKWVSEQLLLEKILIKEFIEEVINEKTERFWKDEILISVLLSNYSEFYFHTFSKILLMDNLELLKRLSFLLKIACKEVDEDFFEQVGIKNVDLFSLEYVLTKPEGKGWNIFIGFVFENINKIGIENISFVLPVVYDWNSKFKKDTVTRQSSLIALKYYQWTIKEDIYYSHHDNNHLLKTIIYGSSEIKNELQEIFSEILENQWKHHKDPYYDFCKFILTDIDGISVCRVLPDYVLKIADLFWTSSPEKEDLFHYGSHIGVEHHFGIEENHSNYFPSSSYQTPIYWLLQFSFKKTLDFILNFTNKSVEHYAKSNLEKNEVEEVEVLIDDNKSKKQYISNRLWCMYRGTQVGPQVLVSIHMALEKFFLDQGKDIDSNILESWLLYLLVNSNSASISAIVTSVVLAYHEKTFNVAKILFQTKAFFFYDTIRLLHDSTAKSLFTIGYGLNNKRKIHQDERIKTCEDKHRKWSLEHLFLNYQVFRSDGISEEEAKNRQKVLWDILDNYYKELPIESEQTESDKTWRLYLSRMDRRKMDPTTEETKEGILVNWNPEIEPSLKEYSEKSLKKSSEPMKFSSLKMWAYYKITNDEKYKQFEKYNNNPRLALSGVKEILSTLKKSKKQILLDFSSSEDEKYFLFNYSIPAEVCSVLVRDYFRKLSKDEKSFCKDIILEASSLSFKKNYQYQISDGTQSAISVLPVLFDKFPREKGKIKEVLLLTLFNDYPIDAASNHYNSFSITAIHKLWKNHFDDAQSLLLGYLYLKPKYEQLREKIRKDNFKKRIYYIDESQIIKEVRDQNKKDLIKIYENRIFRNVVASIKEIDLFILKTAFQLIPLSSDDLSHKEIVKDIISVFSEKLLSNNREDKIDYSIRHDFIERLSYFVLSAPIVDIADYLKPFINNFNGSEAIAELFDELISAYDYLNSYDRFWETWNLFKDRVIDLCKNGDQHWYVSKVLKSYLFAGNPWKESAKDWHTFKTNDKWFFKDISKKLGHCPSALYSISKLLYGIGDFYLDDGIFWIADMIQSNKELVNASLETKTIYYLEHISKKFIYSNREKIRTTKKIKKNVLSILDFLIEKGSVIGYLLRENIL